MEMKHIPRHYEHIARVRIWDSANYWVLDTVDVEGPRRWLQFHQVDCVMPDKENPHTIARPYFLKVWCW
jgi:hypothetical protein